MILSALDPVAGCAQGLQILPVVKQDRIAAVGPDVINGIRRSIAPHPFTEAAKGFLGKHPGADFPPAYAVIEAFWGHFATPQNLRSNFIYFHLFA